MPDYGHDLRFGTFITPVNADPDQPVRLAQHAEHVGFDLATFQDHPYQPAFLDTWTLLSWVAARTERIHVSGNVLNLALRPPGVLARASASLDLLSDGRFELGLGTGGFNDAVVSLGGPTRTPGQGVEALDEAIDVIQGIWSAGERGGFTYPGEHYQTKGAKRGPAPAHDIPIWVGALKPRMLRLIGRKADGWLPSLGYLGVDGLAPANRTIDGAAVKAGRDPREIRRLLNVGGRFGERRGGLLDGPPAQWVEELLPLAVEHGVSTFILAGDDPRAMQVFAEEVAPALRDAVAAERRTAGTETGAVRSNSALAARRPGIDYESIPPRLAERAVEPGDFGYADVRSTYMRGGSPGLVLRPDDVDGLREALAFARAQDVLETVPLSIRSGGHGISGRSTNDGGIVIDLGALDSIEVIDESRRLVRIGPGARWMDVAAALAPYGWALSSGDYGGVGVGGLATAGGIGWLAREHGLTIDKLRAADVLLADGTLVRVSEDEHPDLFWAVRGAGANFGIATSFEFEADEVGEVGFAQLVFDADDTAEFLVAYGAAVEAAPRILTSQVLLGAPRRGQPLYAQVMAVVDSGDADEILAALQPFAEIAPLVDQSVALTTYRQVISNAAAGPHQGQGDPVSRSALITHLTPELAERFAELVRSGATHFFQLRSVGGAVADVPDDATAYANRSANFAASAIGSNAARLDAHWSHFARYFDGLYLSFDTRRDLAAVESAWPAPTLQRLRALKAEYDPENVFRDNFNIRPTV
ncbi:LLM class flavin-dependent oxidoreductase [Agromyces seonyuensis]|uniref:LLM class flavin-dependent oxidoreductase n=1 Tax=Agromyces seonyuensis TaxID=2662446 RepID=A0A6I4P465_9MICO|nr:LLM class flavin-dependent oxidoreductase [Agromyces seonyuensis]MWB98207.1 LLM class flavin-dependent oxidoreductase [Agromyces seonyuensis]